MEGRLEMEGFTPTQLFLAGCFFSSLTAIGARIQKEPLTASLVFHCLFFHGPIGGGLGIGSYEFLAWKWQWRWAFTPIVASIAYGGGIVRIPQVNLRDVLLKALGERQAGDKGNDRNQP